MKVDSKEDLVWRALADPLRRAILDCLAKHPQTTGQLVEQFQKISRTGVMKHLEILVDAGLVVVAKSGRVRWNHLNPVPLENVCSRWLDNHSKRMAAALNRLKEIVEETP